MGTRLGTGVVLVLMVFGFAVSPAPAQPVSDERVAEVMAAALAQTQGAAPAGTNVPASQGAAVDLRLDDAVAHALERNLDIAVERLNPQVFDLSLAGLRAAFSPSVVSTIGQNNAVQLPTNQLVGGQRVQNDTTTYNVGVQEFLPWGGGNFAVTWNNRKLDSNSTFNTFNPQYNSTFSAVYTQPLLRGFRIDQTRQQLLVTAISRDVSEIQLRSTVTNTVANVRNAYWDLAAARATLEVAQRSLDLAEKLVEDNKVRVEVGTLAPIDVVQAQAEAASRRQAVAVAETTARTAELALKRLIVGGTDDPLWSATLRPIDVPVLTPIALDLEAAIRRALSERTDLQQARKQLDSNGILAGFLRNQTLPALDVVASYGLQGIGGTRFIRQGGLGGAVTDTIPGGFIDALNAIGHRDYPNWNLQLQFSYPLGTSSAEAGYARAKVQINQSQAQIRALELQAATDVTTQAVQIQSNLKRVEAARAARELAERRLEAEQSKFEVGMSTNFFVVQAQRDLLDAQITELRATLDYQKATVDFERVQQTPANRGSSVTAVSTGGAGTTQIGTGQSGGTRSGGSQ